MQGRQIKLGNLMLKTYKDIFVSHFPLNLRSRVAERHALRRYQSEKIKLLNISLPNENRTCRVHSICILLYDKNLNYKG